MSTRPANCPRCGGDDTRPSSKGSALRSVFGLIGLRAIRCRHCLHIFWRFRAAAKTGAGDRPAGRSRSRRKDRRPSGAELPTPLPGEHLAVPPHDAGQPSYRAG